MLCLFFFFFQAEDGIRDVERSRGLGDVYKRQYQRRVHGLFLLENQDKMVAQRVSKHKTYKHPKQFVRHQSDRYSKLAVHTWRKPKGIDSCVRRRFRGEVRMPKIGYGTAKTERHVLPCGLLKFRVQTLADLEMLVMQNKKYGAEICNNVSRKNRKAIIDRAAQLLSLIHI
eukprot:TRINITY_DN28885_c0_g1_i1.p2 TRINITY_DN28885_c0_g1~~TRINITY_DN28885_c0_g1_i1.p2  ORF type:complete len:171 (+),score=59.70 TRINITY_DN28885_c0_g1_i1:61-573(+)